MTKHWRKQSIIRKQETKDKQELMSHRDRQSFLKTSSLGKLLEVDYLLPELDEEIEDWISVPIKNSTTIMVKAKYTGRKKPLPYLENE